MILPINKIGDKILETPCKEIGFCGGSWTDKIWLLESTQKLIKNMIETARFHNAVGLAANQVGVSLRIFIFKDKDEFSSVYPTDFKIAINPEIYQYSVQSPSGVEGCLSVPKIEADVLRSEWINVRYFDERGHKIDRTLSGITARIFQHEYDHIQGINFLSKATKIYYRK